jgi:hypothetical protein
MDGTKQRILKGGKIIFWSAKSLCALLFLVKKRAREGAGEGQKT